MSHTPEWRFVRLKPYDPAKGHLRKRHVVAGQHFRQDPDPDVAWKRFDISNPNNRQLVEYLETCVQIPPPSAPIPLFDIATEEERARIIHQERMASRGSVGMPLDYAAPQKPRPPKEAVATPITSTAPPPVEPVSLASPRTLPSQVLEDERQWAESKAAAAPADAKPAKKKPGPKRTKRAPAKKKR